jgi:hypothetical protein
VLNLIANKILSDFSKDCRSIEEHYQKTFTELLAITGRGASQKKLSYIRELPLTCFKDYETGFEKAQQTGINPLTGEKVLFFLKSTGSTGREKQIPLTRSYFSKYRSHFKARGAMLQKQFGVFRLKPEHAFFIPGLTEVNGIPSGHMGLYLYNQIPGFMKRKWALSTELSNDLELYETYGDLAIILNNLKGLSGTIPAGLSALFNRVNARREEFIARINKPDRFLQRYFSEHKITQQRLQYVLQLLSDKDLAVSNIWPEMKFLCFWQSGAGELQFRQIKNGIAERTAIIDQVYNSTEGAFNLPWLDKVGGPIMPSGIILEFLDLDTGEVLFPWEIEAGKEYELVVSNFIGMMRYRIGDIVKCTGFFHRTAEIHFSRRVGGELSFGWYSISLSEIGVLFSNENLDNVIIAPDPSMLAPAVYWCNKEPGKLRQLLVNHLTEKVPYYRERLRDGTANKVGIYELPAQLFSHWKSKIKEPVQQSVPENIVTYIQSDQRSR